MEKKQLKSILRVDQIADKIRCDKNGVYSIPSETRDDIKYLMRMKENLEEANMEWQELVWKLERFIKEKGLWNEFRKEILNNKENYFQRLENLEKEN